MEHEEFPEDFVAWSGIAAAPNGKLYCSPMDASRVLVINQASWELETLCHVGNEKGKWGGITATPDGKLYCAPWHHTCVLMIDTDIGACTFIDVAPEHPSGS